MKSNSFHVLIRDSEGDLVRTGKPLRSFYAAVLFGKSLVGWGQFHVECPEFYTPTREEQLLLPPKISNKKKQQLLDSL